MYREYLVPRREAIKRSSGRLVCKLLCMSVPIPLLTGVLALDLLTVDPRHQKRGAGRMLVQWGTDIADKLGFEVRVPIAAAPNSY